MGGKRARRAELGRPYSRPDSAGSQEGEGDPEDPQGSHTAQWNRSREQQAQRVWHTRPSLQETTPAPQRPPKGENWKTSCGKMPPEFRASWFPFTKKGN